MNDELGKRHVRYMGNGKWRLGRFGASPSDTILTEPTESSDKEPIVFALNDLTGFLKERIVSESELAEVLLKYMNYEWDELMEYGEEIDVGELVERHPSISVEEDGSFRELPRKILAMEGAQAFVRVIRPEILEGRAVVFAECLEITGRVVPRTSLPPPPKKFKCDDTLEN